MDPSTHLAIRLSFHSSRFIQPYTHTHTHTHTHASIHPSPHKYIHTYTHIHICAHTYSSIHTYTHTYIHTHTHTYLPIHMHSHTHPPMCASICSVCTSPVLTGGQHCSKPMVIPALVAYGLMLTEIRTMTCSPVATVLLFSYRLMGTPAIKNPGCSCREHGFSP